MPKKLKTLPDREILQLDRIQKLSCQLRDKEAIIADFAITIKAVHECPWVGNLDDATQQLIADSMRIINERNLT